MRSDKERSDELTTQSQTAAQFSPIIPTPFAIRFADRSMVKNAGVGGGKNKVLLDDLGCLQKKATAIETRLSTAILHKEVVVAQVKELTMDYEERVEVKDGFCEALKTVCEQYEKKREEVVGRIARQDSAQSKTSSTSSFDI